jgi:hypothetical protein
MHSRSLHFHSSNTEINSSGGIMLRMVLTAVNTSTGSPNVDPSNFLFSVPNSQKSHGARFWLYDGWGSFVIPRWSKCRGARCGMTLSRWRKVALERFLGRFRARSLSKSAKTFPTKNSRSNVSVGDNRTTFPIPAHEKQTQIITFFALMNGRTRVGFTTFTPVHIEDRRLL